MGEFLGYLTDAVLLLITLRFLYGALRQLLAPRAAAQGGGRGVAGAAAPVSPGEMARDPECGMFVSTEVSRRLKRGGQTLHFCSDDCLEKYKRRAS